MYQTKTLKRVVVTRSNRTGDDGMGYRTPDECLKIIQERWPDIEWKFCGCIMDNNGFQAYVTEKKSQEIEAVEGR